MKQATLATFLPEAPQKCFGCDTCVCNLGIVVVSSVEKVHCRGQGLKPVNRIGCSGHWDGSNRADHWPTLPGPLNRAEPIEAKPPACPECGATLRRRPAKHIHAGLHYCQQCGYTEQEAVP